MPYETTMPKSDQPRRAMLAKERHIKYWLRCLRTLLPSGYTSTDSSRMSLAFFTLAALDLLDILNSTVSSTDRQGYIDWIYQCQLPTGGFRGSPSHDLGDLRSPENEYWDPATVPMTFFALSSLLVLGDDFSRVEREDCLSWLRLVQHPNGCFGEFLGEDGKPKGGCDPRQCGLAAGIRYILRGQDPPNDLVDIDVEKLVSFIASCQTYDGGYSEGPFNESHAGFTYCATSVLFFLGRIPANPRKQDLSTKHWKISFQESIRFLVLRQTTDIFEDEESDETSTPEETSPYPVPPALQGVIPVESKVSRSFEPVQALDIKSEDIQHAGFNGRVNKIADTCYCFFVEGSLAMLGCAEMIDRLGLRRYLLEKTQHVVGGFAKAPGEPPDILHSYLGLAALSVMGERDLESFDPGLCTSSRARDFMKTLPWWRGDRRTMTIPFRSKKEGKKPVSNTSGG